MSHQIANQNILGMETTMTKKQKRQLDKWLHAYSNKARTGLSKNGKLVAQSAMAVGAVLAAGGVQGQTAVPLDMGTVTATPALETFNIGIDLDGIGGDDLNLIINNSVYGTWQFKQIVAQQGYGGAIGDPLTTITTYGNLDATNRFVGVTFNKGGTDYYGWLEIVYDPLLIVVGEPAYTLVDFYVSDSPVVAGEKDHPAAVPLSPLALGAKAGLMGLYTLLRNRRRKEKVEVS